MPVTVTHEWDTQEISEVRVRISLDRPPPLKFDLDFFSRLFMQSASIAACTIIALEILYGWTLADGSIVKGLYVVDIVGASQASVTGPDEMRSPDPLVTAVGCFHKITLTIQRSQENALTGQFDIFLCQRLSNGRCLDKGTGQGNDWLKSTDFARLCCASYPEDRKDVSSLLNAQDVCSDVSNYYDIYSCTSLVVSTNTVGAVDQAVASIIFIPPFGADLSNQGETEVCIGISEPVTLNVVPICVSIQVLFHFVAIESNKMNDTLWSAYGRCFPTNLLFKCNIFPPIMPASC
jgi:hypothetical protein